MSDDSTWVWTHNGWRPRQLPSDIEGAKSGDVLTQEGWTKGKTPLHAKIMAIGEKRIRILEDKANDALIQPGIEYGKIQTAIKEVKILLDLIREIKI